MKFGERGVASVRFSGAGMVRFREGGVACVWVSFRGGMVSFSGGGVASACISYRQGGVACVCVGFRGAGMVSFRESVINAKNMILPNMIKDWDLYLRTTGIGLRKKKRRTKYWSSSKSF